MIQQQPVPQTPFIYQEAPKSPFVNQSSPVDLAVDGVKDLICFSHLRWNFVYQRPQHLLSRASETWRIWFIEEPVFGDEDRLEVRTIQKNLTVVVPHLRHGISHEAFLQQQREAVDQVITQNNIHDFIAWYYTPMAFAFSNHIKPRLTIYDCMDELSAFLGAPRSLLDLEKALLKQANLVFTGGKSLYEAKQGRHPNVFAFPSSIDYNHYEPARHDIAEPADLQNIPNPRIGFCGVIDERMNVQLLTELAQRRPDWHFVLLGPIVKIDPAMLPQGDNLHYLGMKSYKELPAYFGHLDVAIMPFAINEATRYISPTKTPEYLAAGLPVVSTPIHDVVSTYAGWAPVLIADTAPAFEEAIEKALTPKNIADDWSAVDDYLLTHSWDATWQSMNRLIQTQLTLVFQ